MSTPIKPYADNSASKKEQVAGMFNNIAGKYDFLNHFLSLNIDKIWRKKVVNRIKQQQPKSILDVATGTGDLAIACLACNVEKIEGIDISQGMLDVGISKIKQKKCEDIINLQLGDAENIPFKDNTFDAITVAFGVRNFENLLKGLQEMHRVLKPGGTCLILEFTMPAKFPFKQLYKCYFNSILPLIGKLVSKDNSAYTYLPESVQMFAQRKHFIEYLERANFIKASYKNLTFGIAAIYQAYKKQ